MFFIKRVRHIFSVGETARVKSRDAILQSIGPDCMLDGCLFTPQMWEYCGTEHAVSRVVNSLFNERRKRTVQPKAPLYLLDQLTCYGKTENFDLTCDRACFLLWHENWLEKI